MVHRCFVALLLILAAATPVFGAAREGGAIPVQLPLFPTNNWWNTDITNAPVDSGSPGFITFIGPTRGLHPDFGGDAGGGDTYGFPYIIVDGTQPLKTVTFAIANESDGNGVPFYPIPDEAATMFGWVEGGQPGNIDQRATADRHMLIVDKTNNKLFELYNVWFNGMNWVAGSGAFFDMNTNNRRPDTWTSADAAGLAILPGLIRYDEVFGPNEINHAFRVTVRTTNIPYVYPASHQAGSTPSALPMGARLRLKATTNISGYPPEVQKIFRAFKKYGLIVADNGSDMYVSGTYDTRWDNGVLNPRFSALKASDFDVVQLGWQPTTSLQMTMQRSVPKGLTASLTISAFDKSYNASTGYLGTIHFTSTDPIPTLPADYTFIAGDAGTHTFANVILRTPGDQTITATDTLDATITASRIVSVGPQVPTGVVATATSPTSVNVSWDDSPGATQYQIVRKPAFASAVNTAGTTYNDTNVTSGNVYVYSVIAKDAVDSSAASIPDVATTFVFTDDPLIANTTFVKPVHITQLRQVVNLLRALTALGPASFTDSTLDGSVRINAVHLQQIQDALDQARAALLLVPNSYHDAMYSPSSTLVQSANIRELRNGVK